jgi:hypothetical protein
MRFLPIMSRGSQPVTPGYEIVPRGLLPLTPGYESRGWQ